MASITAPEKKDDIFVAIKPCKKKNTDTSPMK